MWHTEQENPERQRVKQKLPEVRRGEERELLMNGYRVSTEVDAKVLEICRGSQYCECA